MKKQLAVILAAAALSACHGRRVAPAPAAAKVLAPPASAPISLLSLRLGLPVRTASVISGDKPELIAENAAKAAKFLAKSRAYDAGMRTIPADQLTDDDRKMMKANERWFDEDRAEFLKLLKRLQAWADASPTVAAAPEKAPE